MTHNRQAKYIKTLSEHNIALYHICNNTTHNRQAQYIKSRLKHKIAWEYIYNTCNTTHIRHAKYIKTRLKHNIACMAKTLQEPISFFLLKLIFDELVHIKYPCPRLFMSQGNVSKQLITWAISWLHCYILLDRT